jgi:hypothetical protein
MLMTGAQVTQCWQKITGLSRFSSETGVPLRQRGRF